MAELTKRSTIYFEPDLHKAIKVKAALEDQSISEIVNEAVKFALEHMHNTETESEPEVVSLLQSWMEDDSPSDESYDLEANLDAARTSHRKLFPPELKGITW